MYFFSYILARGCKNVRHPCPRPSLLAPTPTVLVAAPSAIVFVLSGIACCLVNRDALCDAQLCKTWDHNHSLKCFKEHVKVKKTQVKLCRYSSCRLQGGEEIYILLILDFGPMWRQVVSLAPRLRFTTGKGPMVPIG